MLKRRALSAILILLLLLGMTLPAAATDLPYAIKVNRAQNTVTIYEKDENGEYTVPVKAMICSTARAGHVTPLGNYKLTARRFRVAADGGRYLRTVRCGL